MVPAGWLTVGSDWRVTVEMRVDGVVRIAGTKAASVGKGPGDPPLSFQATSRGSCPGGVTTMPMSWLMPGVAVHRSALPAITMEVPRLPCTLTVSAGSISDQVLPSLLVRNGWVAMAALTIGVWTSCTVSRVGE